MDNWDILPYEGLGFLHLSATRREVRSILEIEPYSFHKAFEETETDAYDALGLHLYYDANGLLEFIEAFEPCNPVYQNKAFIGRVLEQALNEMKEMGYETRYDQEGYFFDNLGFVLYAPDGVIKAVSVYGKGYY